jgi:hypothetical protein
MKKTNKPVPKTPAKKAPATKQLAAKPKAKPASKPKPRKAQGQAQLAQVVAQLATSAEKLAQAADRLAEATVRKLQEQHERQDQTFKTLSESIAERTASEEHPPEVAGVPDLTTPEGANITDSTALEEYPGMPEPSEDE